MTEIQDLPEMPPETVMDQAEASLQEQLASLEIVPAPPQDIASDGDGEDRLDKGDIAKSGPPRIDEWQDFIGRIAIKLMTDMYMDAMFRGIDESVLTDRDIQALTLSAQDRKAIAKPFAELAHKNKFMRKHGREIVSSVDAIEAAMRLAKWARAVSRIAKRYRPAHQPKQARRNQPHNQGVQNNGDFRPSSAPVSETPGTVNGVIIDSYSGN